MVSVTSRLLPDWSNASHQCFGRIVSSPTICGNSRFPAEFERKGDIALPGPLSSDHATIIGGRLRIGPLERVEGENDVVRKITG